MLNAVRIAVIAHAISLIVTAGFTGRFVFAQPSESPASSTQGRIVRPHFPAWEQTQAIIAARNEQVSAINAVGREQQLAIIAARDKQASAIYAARDKQLSAIYVARDEQLSAIYAAHAEQLRIAATEKQRLAIFAAIDKAVSAIFAATNEQASAIFAATNEQISEIFCRTDQQIAEIWRRTEQQKAAILGYKVVPTMTAARSQPGWFCANPGERVDLSAGVSSGTAGSTPQQLPQPPTVESQLAREVWPYAPLSEAISDRKKTEVTGIVRFLSIGETKTTTPSVELDPSISKRVIRALDAAPKHIKAAMGNGDAAHQKAAYEWGYEVGDPAVISALRSSAEVGQFFVFTTIDGLVKLGTAGQMHGPYQPTTINGPGGLLDSINDVRNATQGAMDKANGLPPNPPY
jgi:hypothetical protein